MNGAYLAMCGRSADPHLIAAWPTAFFDVMGPEAGVMLVDGKEIVVAQNPQRRKEELLDALARQSSAEGAAALGLIDDVIKPVETRPVLLNALRGAEAALAPGFRHHVEP